MYNKENILVSIIIPAYNVESRIENCINSVLKQTYHNLEIIIINDGSTDNTYQIISAIEKQEKRVIVINQENKGVSAARNIGVIRSSGQLIMFLDADDYIVDNCIEKMLLKYDEDIDLVVCAYQIKNEQEHFVFQNHKVEVYEGERKMCEFILINGREERLAVSAPWGKLFKSSIIKEYNLQFIEGLQIGEDTLFVLDYCEKIKKVICTYEQLYIYWNSSDSLSSLGKDIVQIVKARLLILEKKVSILTNKKLLYEFPVINNESLLAVKIFVLNAIYDRKGNYKKYLKCIESMKKNIIFTNSIKRVIPKNFIDYIIKILFLNMSNEFIAMALVFVNFILKKNRI